MKIYIRTDINGNILIVDISGNVDDTIEITDYPTDCEWWELSLNYLYIDDQFVRNLYYNNEFFRK
jgi:hypothetical protein